jgi:hypothetical protein
MDTPHCVLLSDETGVAIARASLGWTEAVTVVLSGICGFLGV